MLRRTRMLGIISLLFSTILLANTASAEEFVEGQDYIVLPQEVRQQAVVQSFLNQDAGKIQVTEFFSYKCPACYALEGPFEAWAAKQGAGVAVRKVPVSFGPTWEPVAKAYYALEELGQIKQMSPIIFNAIHKDRLRLETQSEIAAVVSRNGVDINAFNSAYEGFNVSRLWGQAQLLRQAEQVTSIPAIVVNGHYLTHMGLAKDPTRLTQIIDYLIERARGDSNL